METQTMGQKIKQACREANLSLARLAAMIDVHSSTTSDWSRDVANRKPPLVKLRAIADATGKPLSFFIEALHCEGDDEYAETILDLADMIGREDAMKLLAAAVPEAVRRREESKRARHAAD